MRASKQRTGSGTPERTRAAGCCWWRTRRGLAGWVAIWLATTLWAGSALGLALWEAQLADRFPDSGETRVWLRDAHSSTALWMGQPAPAAFDSSLLTAIERFCPSIDAVCPIVERWRTAYDGTRRLGRIRLVGIGCPLGSAAQELTIVGEGLRQDDLSGQRSGCLLDARSARSWFGQGRGEGAQIRCGAQRFRIRGLVSGASRASRSATAYVGLAALQQELGLGSRFEILAIRVAGPQWREAARRELRDLLATRDPDAPAPNLRSASELRNDALGLGRMARAGSLLLAAFALAVGTLWALRAQRYGLDLDAESRGMQLTAGTPRWALVRPWFVRALSFGVGAGLGGALSAVLMVAFLDPAPSVGREAIPALLGSALPAIVAGLAMGGEAAWRIVQSSPIDSFPSQRWSGVRGGSH